MNRFASAIKTVSPIFLICFAASAPAAVVSDDSSWSSKPSWASDSGTSAPRQRNSAGVTQQRYSPSNPNLSPFAPGSSNVSLEMGQVFLLGDLGNKYSDAIGTAVHYTYGVSDLFGFESSLGYSNHSDGNLSMLSFQAGLRTNLAWYDRIIPYFSFGLGFYRPSYDVGALKLTSDPNESVSPLLFGLHMGPGVDLQITRQFFFGASISLNEVFGNSQTLSNGQSFDVGGSYASFFLHAGMTF